VDACLYVSNQQQKAKKSIKISQKKTKQKQQQSKASGSNTAYKIQKRPNTQSKNVFFVKGE